MTFCSCNKEKNTNNNVINDTNGSILINYNNNQFFQIPNLSDSCAFYDTINHRVYVNTNLISCYNLIMMEICINLDNIEYPFLFPKKNVNFVDYIHDIPDTAKQFARISFNKILSPDTNISDFKMISASNVAKFILTNYTNNRLSGSFQGTFYMTSYHATCEYLPIDILSPIDSMKVNFANFNVKLIKN